MDNLSQQTDEIEALKSIYDELWVIEDGMSSYSMQVSPEVKLFVTLNQSYPQDSPPTYELFAPELSFEQKNTIKEEFQSIFEENMGSPILFQWIEKLKEISHRKTKKENVEEKLKPQVVDTPNKNLGKYASEVTHGPIIEDRKSVFQGHVCTVTSESDVKNVLEYLMDNKKIAQATHNIHAYRISKDKSILQDCEDDGENHASRRLLHLLQILDLHNVMVVVSRWYGGIQLGPDRFKHITNAARQALVAASIIK